MAGAATIGALRVVLGADTALFEKGLKDSQSALAKFGRDMSAIAGGISLERVINNIVHSLKTLTIGALHNADEMGKMAQRIGIPVEQLSAFRLAADLSGVSMEQLGVAVGRLSRNMSEIAGGATNTASRAFEALKISVKNSDGSLKTSSQIMEEVADRFRSMQDGAGKTALAIAIFGRSGAQMIPLLNQGAAGLREAREEAAALGLVISRQTAAASEAFNDNMRRLGLVTQGIALQLAAELSPALAVLTGHMVEAAKEGNVVKAAAEGIKSAFFALSEDLAIATIKFRNIGAELNALGRLINAVVFKASDLSAAWENYNRVQNEIASQTGNVRQSLEQLRSEVTNFVQAVGKLGTAAAAPVIATETAFDKFLKTQAKALAAEQAELQTIGQVAGARERLRIILQGQAVAQENNIRLTAAQQVQLTAAAERAAGLALAQERMNVIMQNRTPWEVYQAEIQKLNVLFENGERAGESYGNAMEKAAERAGISWKQQVPSIAGSFSEIANAFASEGNKLAKAAQVLSAFQALVSTYAGSAEALKLPFPFNIAASAAVLAKGLALVAAIKGFAAPKMATGGALRMPGLPGSGVDKQLMVARVRPDEQVDIWRPGEGSDPRRGAGGAVQNITLNISDRGMREFWASGIDHINSLTDDGYRLKVA